MGQQQQQQSMAKYPPLDLDNNNNNDNRHLVLFPYHFHLGRLFRKFLQCQNVKCWWILKCVAPVSLNHLLSMRLGESCVLLIPPFSRYRSHRCCPLNAHLYCCLCSDWTGNFFSGHRRPFVHTPRAVADLDCRVPNSPNPPETHASKHR